MHFSLGEQLETICVEAINEVVLVAPFVKEHVLKRLLDCISHEVSVKVVTRWNPYEIQAGVSDLSIWPLIRARENTSLFLCSHLHAKYFRVDSRCLVGSANMTGKALGWNKMPNLELLVSLDYQSQNLPEFEQELFANSIAVNEYVHQYTLEAVAALPVIVKPIEDEKQEPTETEDTESGRVLPAYWLPATRFPENLYKAYCGEQDKLTGASRASTESDLAFLSIPPGLSNTSFNLLVGAMLLQSPIISEIDSFLTLPRRFGAVTAFLRSLPCAELPDFEANYSWQTLVRWFLLFLPHRYSKVKSHYSEVFVRRDP